jgi:hypothetical protein
MLNPHKIVGTYLYWEKDAPCLICGVHSIGIDKFKVFDYKHTGLNFFIVICSLYMHRGASLGACKYINRLAEEGHSVVWLSFKILQQTLDPIVSFSFFLNLFIFMLLF